MANRETHISAPGKVLLTGGYLVLDQRFQGLVIAIDSRFHVVVKEVPCATVVIDRQNIQISVRSPQFIDGEWEYKFDTVNGILYQLDPQEKCNKFVASALYFSLGFIRKSKGFIGWDGDKYLDIQILGDNDFYSQLEYLRSKGDPINIDSLLNIPKFNHTQSNIGNVKKTGLGSSAAMTSSLVSAILLHFDTIDIHSINGIKIAHNVAQASHCFAQGKIGSGFDVCSAIFGTHAYQRFSPLFLNSIFENDTLHSCMTDSIYDSLNQRWDHQIVASKLPHGFLIQLGDISTGSNTPSMVSKLLHWRKENEKDCELLWKELDSKNTELLNIFNSLDDFYAANQDLYIESLKVLSTLNMKCWIESKNVEIDEEFLKLIIAIYDCYQIIRFLMKGMGKRAGISIEPDEQTRLIDDCLDVPGVIMAGVPGAGGFDAIFCIAAGNDAKRNLLKVWERTRVVTPLLSSVTGKGIAIERNDA